MVLDQTSRKFLRLISEVGVKPASQNLCGPGNSKHIDSGAIQQRRTANNCR